MTFIDIPDRRPRFKAFGAGLASPGVRVLDYEVTQAVQNLDHDVRLFARKPTVVRVYLEASGLPPSAELRGELLITTRRGAPGAYVASANAFTVSAVLGEDLKALRREATASLNFLLPAPPSGPMLVQLNSLTTAVGGVSVPIRSPVPSRSVSLVDGPVLRIRALGIRYTDPSTRPPETFAPEATHFDHLRSYLRRAFPASSLDWSQAVVNASPDFVPPFSGPTLPNGADPLWSALLSILHRQVMTIRQADMDAGWDPRTHYYGLVSDDSGFFRGAATDVPFEPAPNTVAVGPCGRPPPGNWDDDQSYGDWYGAHELAHTFGRLHPGFCGQSHDDGEFPHPEGALSSAEEDCVGFDVGDAALGLPMRAYPPEQWTDFMTYCDRQWISKYTYDGLLNRLEREAVEFDPAGGGARP